MLKKRSDDEILEMLSNLGGHCIASLSEAFNSVKDDNPTAFLAYTIKGWGTPLAGHKDNHAGLMTKEQMSKFKSKMKIKMRRMKSIEGKLHEYVYNCP